MGRQEQPIPPGPLHDFARDLRRLRLEAGQPSYRALSRKARYSASALSAAAAGQMLPTRGVTRAYVEACGGDPHQWEQRWQLLAAQLRAADPELPPSSPPAADADPTPRQPTLQPAPDTATDELADEPAAVVTGVPRPQEQAASAAPTTSGRPRIIVRFGLGPLLIVAAIITALLITNARSPDGISAGPPAGTPSSEAATPPETGSVTSSPRRQTTPAPSVSPVPSRAAGPAPVYRLVYGNRTLTTKDYNSSIDLTTGRVVGDTGRWLLGTNSGGDGKGAFELQDATDAVIIGQHQPTAAECTTAATGHPLHALLHFAQTPAGTWFCLRWQLSGDIAVVQTLDMDTGEYGVNVTVSYYQHR